MRQGPSAAPAYSEGSGERLPRVRPCGPVDCRSTPPERLGRQLHYGLTVGRLAPFLAASPRLPVARDRPLRICEHATFQQPFDEVHLVADRVVTHDLALHRVRGSAAVQADDRVPAPLVRCGEILDEPGRLDAAVRFVEDLTASNQGGWWSSSGPGRATMSPPDTWCASRCIS